MTIRMVNPLQMASRAMPGRGLSVIQSGVPSLGPSEVYPNEDLPAEGSAKGLAQSSCSVRFGSTKAGGLVAIFTIASATVFQCGSVPFSKAFQVVGRSS
jgi:hypothetical protein